MNEWKKYSANKQASKRANKQTNNKNAKLVRYIWYECFVRFSFSLSLALSRSERVCLCLCAFTFVSVCCWAQFKWLNEWKPLCISNVIISVYCSLRTALCTPLRPVRVCVLCTPCIQFSEVVKTTKMKPHNSHRTIYFTMCSFSERTERQQQQPLHQQEFARGKKSIIQ